MKIRIGEEPQEISSNVCNIFPLLIPLISAGVSAIGSAVGDAMSDGDKKKPPPPGAAPAPQGLQGSNMAKPVDVTAKTADPVAPPPAAAPPPIMTPSSGSGLGGSIAPPQLPAMGGIPKEEERFA